MLFADIERSQDFLTALEQFATRPVVIAMIAIFGLIAGVFAYFHFRRERLLRHQERMAMIEAGIHPDYPPEDSLPTSQTDGGSVSKETTDHRPK